MLLYLFFSLRVPSYFRFLSLSYCKIGPSYFFFFSFFCFFFTTPNTTRVSFICFTSQAELFTLYHQRRYTDFMYISLTRVPCRDGYRCWVIYSTGFHILDISLLSIEGGR